jgi:hypothetical protein
MSGLRQGREKRSNLLDELVLVGGHSADGRKKGGVGRLVKRRERAGAFC